jgi:cytochrome b involved in lipid metabolism
MVLDMTNFLQFHPGGQFVITKRIGYDITGIFKGSSYSGNTEEGANEMGHMHSNQARLIAY